MSAIEWHGGNPYGTCEDCGKPVRLNKPLLGALHLCVTECAKRGHHSGPYFTHRRVGPFWKRRDEYRCRDCDDIMELPAAYRVEVVAR